MLKDIPTQMRGTELIEANCLPVLLMIILDRTVRNENKMVLCKWNNYYKLCRVSKIVI